MDSAGSTYYHLPLRPRSRSKQVSPSRSPRHSRNHSLASDTHYSSARSIAGHDAPGQLSKRFPESLHFAPSAMRGRSPTQSSISSVLSGTLLDSSTIHSISTMASPISTTYNDEIQDQCSAELRPMTMVRHRKRYSIATCSTLINDDDDCISYQKSDDGHDYMTDDERWPGPAIHIVPIKEEDDQTTTVDCDDGDDEKEGLVQGLSDVVKWETGSTASEDFHPEDADRILDFTMQLVYGMNLKDSTVMPQISHQLVQKFVQDIGQQIWENPTEGDLTNATTISTDSMNSTPSGVGASQASQRGDKRKKQSTGGDEEEEPEDVSDGQGSGGPLPVKRPKPNPKEEENLRLSCPYRKRNPHRFNVRDHHSCAMTYFPKFAELRQHIVKQHKRDDPSAFICDRCTRDFPSRKQLRDHQRLPKELMCDISDHDPESGIDGPTSNKLLSRKRASGSSAEIQWREIWNILFPDDEDQMVKIYDFVPVIEHFELSAHYLDSFDSMSASLRDKISNPATLDTLTTKFHQCFIETVERCISVAQDMPYANRSNKRGSDQPSSSLPQRVRGPGGILANATLAAAKHREVRPRPDSGVVIDDGSEGSGGAGSVVDTAAGHRDSMRTLKSTSRRVESMREVLPMSSDGIPTSSSQHLTSLETLPQNLQDGGSTLHMGHSEVQAWSDGVMYSCVDPAALGFQGDYLGDLGVDGQMEQGLSFGGGWTELARQTDFGGMDAGFSGFRGQQQ